MINIINYELNILSFSIFFIVLFLIIFNNYSFIVIWGYLICYFNNFFFFLFYISTFFNIFKLLHFILSNFLLVNIFNIEIDFFFVNYYNFFIFNYCNFISVNLFTHLTLNYLFIEKVNFILNETIINYNFYIDLLNKHLDFTFFNLIFNLSSSYNLILTNFNLNKISFYLEFNTLGLLYVFFFGLIAFFFSFKNLFKF